jgi:hypothetical protein
MNTKTGSSPMTEEQGKRYPIRYGVKEYTFPSNDTIADVRLDDQYLHVHLADGRILCIPLAWIPPLRDASHEERQKFHISEDRTLIIWDPDESEVNEILRISDYLRRR